MPGMPGWMDDVDRAIDQLKPDSFKGYTVGDNTNKQLARHPWRMDDEKLLYPFYEKLVKAGLVNVCVHKGLYPLSTTQRFPQPRPLCRRARRGQGRQRLAAAQLRHLPFRLPVRRRRVGHGLGAIRADGARGLGHRPRGDSRQVRRHQRLRRPRPDLRPEHGGRAAPVRGHDGHAGQGARLGPRGVGNGRRVDGVAAVADRGPPAARDPGGHAEEVRVRPARPGRRPRQARDLRRELGAAVQVRPPGGPVDGPHRAAPGRIRARGAGRTNRRYGFVARRAG